MHSTARNAFVLALAAMPAFLGACKSEKKTTIYQQIPLGTSDFPGTMLWETALAEDGMAFSAPGTHFVRMNRYDSGRGEAIFLFEATATVNAATHRFLFATHFDGASFTPPVELLGANQDPLESPNLDQALVAFLFPGNARNGDAVICFQRRDLDDGGGNASMDPNRRLYVTYFDRSERATAVSPADPAIRYGFDGAAEPLDLTDDDHAGADVDLAGFCSGGTLGAQEFFPVLGERNRIRQGNDTPFLTLFWTQAASAGSPVRLHGASFDLAETNAGNQFGAAAELPLDASAAATDDVAVLGLDVLDGAVYFLKEDGTNTLLLAAVFDPVAGAFASPAVLLSPDGANPDMAELPGGDGLFGSEAGLTRTVGLFRHTGGALGGEASLFAFQLDPAAPAAPFTAGTDLVELDAGNGTTVPWNVAPFILGAPGVLNRTGTWILVTWVQDQQELVSVPSLWVNAIQTPRDAAPPALSSAVSGALRVDQAAGTDPGVADFIVQAELGYGGIQSHRDRISVAWQQDGGAGDDTLRFNTLAFTAGTPPSVARGSEGSVTFNNGTLDLATILLVDGGGAGGTAGAPMLYYVRDARTASPASMRAYQYRVGVGEIEIGTLAGSTAGTYHPQGALAVRALTAPRNADVVLHPDWAGTAHHLFFEEYRFLDTAGSTALRHRVFAKDSTAAGAGDRFLPAADGLTPPSTVDTGLDLPVTWLGAGLKGESVGLFFAQADHVWYNEYHPAARVWRTSCSLVDDLWPNAVQDAGLLPAWKRQSTDDLSGAVVYFSKNFSAPASVHRLFVRAKD